MKWTAGIGTAALMSTGALAAVASPGDSSTASGTFVSGTLFTGIPLDSVAGAEGVSASNPGNPDPVTETGTLDVTALSAIQVSLPNGLDIPFGQFMQLGAVNQYAQASDAGVSRAASGAVGNDGAVDVDGSGAFPADATVDLTKLLGSQTALSAANLHVGAVSGVAALSGDGAAPATSCADISDPVNCRDYNVANAGLNLTSPLVGQLVTGVNGTLDTVSGTVNGLSDSLGSAVLGQILDIPALSSILGSGDNSTITATVNADLRSALAPELAGTLSQDGVTLNLDDGTITVDLATVIGGLNDRDLNTPLLSADVISSVVSDVDGILQQLQTNINTALATALDAVPVTISGGVCVPLGGCAVGGLTVSYNGTLGDLASGDAVVTVTGTGTVGSALGPVLSALTGGLSTALSGVVTPVRSSAISTVSTAVASDVTTLSTALDPVLTSIGTVVGATLNVQEPGTDSGAYREVALRVSLLSGSGATVDLGRAEVGPNVAVPASITSIDPTHGPQTGGTTVTITGSGFTQATGVTFGGDQGTGFTIVDDSHITVTTPAHDPGDVPVVVQSPNGDSGPGTFTFDVIPAINGLNPTSGPETGGTSVTITGTGFTAATGVTFGGTAATDVTVVDDSHITATTPAHAPGGVDVVVQSSNGDSGPGTFTYTPVTTIDGVDPGNGPEAGGNTVTITGRCFTGATSVTFGGIPVTSFSVGSDTQITAVVPAGTGTVDVVVVGSAACGTGTDQNAYTYNPAPVIDSLSPDHGPEAGGTTVTITGTGFTGATGVTFGGVAGTNLTIIDDTHLTIDSPAHAAGQVDVVVTTPLGSSEPQAFTYDPVPSITSLSPDHGPQTGGTDVTITGTGFAGATGVTFDGIQGTNFSQSGGTTITVTTPVHAPGLVSVVVQSPNGDSEPGGFTFDPVTTVDGIDPGTGPEAGGNTVTITGQCFTGATDVTFGGVSATSFQVVSDTEITAVVPAGTGTVDVSVIGAGTCGTGTDPGGYDYVPTPSVASLTPDHGPQTGGTVVTVSGTGFTNASGVTFDGTPGDDFTVLDDSTIRVTSPEHAPGPVDVVVTDPVRNSDAATFTFDPVAQIATVNPGSGPEAGGTTVVITGQCFTNATEVTFGGSDATNVTIDSPTQITAVTPAGTGVVDVSVVTTDCGTATLPGAFTYVAPSAPVIASITPDHGPETGGTVVTITGTGFTGTTNVTFDGVPALSVIVDSDTQLTATTPAHVPAAVQVVVTSPVGPSAPGAFTYDPATRIDSVDPSTGPEEGGTSVVITGQCFTGATAVTFGTTNAVSYTVDSDGQITAVTPAGTGTVDVTVVGGGDCGSATDPDAFAYVAAPTIQSLTPTEGPTAGGTSVTITGTGFTGASAVDFGGTPAASFTVDDATHITATTPAHSAGAVDVTVTTVGGTSGPGQFTFVAPAAIESIDPNHGPETGGTTVTITGTGFTDATGATFGGSAGGDFVVVDDTTITVTTPPGTPGSVDVIVTSPHGDSPAGTFTYDPVTTITGVSPSSGPEDGGSQVTITGHCFTDATAVLFGGTDATSFTVVDDTTITAVTPAGVGTVDVVVVGTAECGTGTAPGGFTYVPSTDPIIYGLTPNRGPETGGTVVTITGANFDGATGATFDGLAGTSFTVDSDTQITVTSPAHVPATVDVIVFGPDVQASPGTSLRSAVTLAAAAANSQSNAGRFTYYAVTDVHHVDPGSGPASGGTTVTITGHCFTGATQVLFGGTAAARFTVVNDTTITAVTPAGSGKVDVTVVGSGDCGTSTLKGGFTYLTPAEVLAATGAVSVGIGGILAAIGLLAAGIVLMVLRRRRIV
ncbi:IPT/TIG domain-containing protein [Humibacter sp.]|uniref:IPT/TIG domain-containing protein n=1 Tax=Humibacter sp. TaxID=1940291 RepID=UPI002CDBCCB6|nr:IPT/TIG domain-containing protein [Humibacter sp.]HVX07592.1 IPT/TIG domain-containing protein [Humibacter sp.]